MDFQLPQLSTVHEFQSEKLHAVFQKAFRQLQCDHQSLFLFILQLLFFKRWSSSSIFLFHRINGKEFSFPIIFQIRQQVIHYARISCPKNNFLNLDASCELKNTPVIAVMSLDLDTGTVYLLLSKIKTWQRRWKMIRIQSHTFPVTLPICARLGLGPHYFFPRVLHLKLFCLNQCRLPTQTILWLQAY